MMIAMFVLACILLTLGGVRTTLYDDNVIVPFVDSGYVASGFVLSILTVVHFLL